MLRERWSNIMDSPVKVGMANRVNGWTGVVVSDRGGAGAEPAHGP
jgi:hypothetical protein